MGAVNIGYLGIYYLREGADKVQPDLYEMAYKVNDSLQGEGAYLIIQDLQVVNDILDLVNSFGRYSLQVKKYLSDYSQKMHEFWYVKKFSTYGYDWGKFAKKRSTIIFDEYVVKYSGRSRRNFTVPSQRAGHIAVGEMYLSKYFFYGKKIIYLWPKMNTEDIEFLDKHKGNDKEWTILRNESNVEIKTRDDIIGLPKDIYDALEAIKDEPLTNGTHARKEFDRCIKLIAAGLRAGSLKIAE